MSHLALYRKWRPLVFDDVCGQNHITAALRAQVEGGRLSHAYLFTGTRGTGKTTCAKILARAACCEHPVNGNPCNECAACQSVLQDAALDVTEIDAASNNGVDNIREIRDEASYAPSALRRRVYIIDEVHMLSTGAFNALLKTLEEPPEHVLFILATTEIHKVPATILSRCQRYDFRRIPPETIAQRLLDVASSEKLELASDAAALLARLGDGSMRDALSLLERSVTQDGVIGPRDVTSALGVASSETLTGLAEAVLRGDGGQALDLFTAAYLDGRDIVSLFDELLSVLRDLYLLRATGRTEYLMSMCASDPDRLRQMADSADAATLEYLVGCISDLLSRLTRTAIKRVDAEMCLMKMCLRHESGPAQPRPAARAAAPVSRPAPAPDKETPPDSFVSQAGDTPPWEEEQVSAPRPVPAAPQRTQAPQTAHSAAKERFVSAVSGKVNSAVRTYLSLADIAEQDGALAIEVLEESLIFMEKPATLEVFSQAALDLGYSGVSVTKKGAKKAPPSQGMQEVLSRAQQLGVPIEKK